MDEIRSIILKVEELKIAKNFEQAISLLQKTLVKYSDDYRLYEELADIYLYIGDNKKAFSALDFSLTLNDQSATGNYLKGFILLGEDKVAESISYLEKSNILFGNNAEVLRNLGWAYTMSGQHERGITVLKRALNISPEDELITEDLAMALIGTGEISAGNRLLKKIGKSTTQS
jgi:tetratricopeptide (TPR) repeat protein